MLVGYTLAPEAWAEKLAGTPLADAVGAIDPQHSVVIVVEQDRQVVAQCIALTSVHVEALWEAEEVRGQVGVSRALLDALVRELLQHRVGEVLAQSLTPETDALMEGAGGRRLPGTTWVIPVKEG